MYVCMYESLLSRSQRITKGVHAPSSHVTTTCVVQNYSIYSLYFLYYDQNARKQSGKN